MRLIGMCITYMYICSRVLSSFGSLEWCLKTAQAILYYIQVHVYMHVHVYTQSCILYMYMYMYVYM